jgi:threonine aldolase
MADEVVVDLRSDTVTRPTRAMLDRMRSAPLGDDGLDGDPTARELEDRTARLLGKEAGLFVPTATMGNLIAVLAHRPSHANVLLPASAHMRVSRGAALTMLGAQLDAIPEREGAMDLDRLEHALASSAGSPLVVVEETHAASGGSPVGTAHLAEVRRLADAAGSPVHIDGARLCNAAVASDVPPSALAEHADSVVLCLSKGLSAPVGAVLVGSRPFVTAARALRKQLGGTQRQVGVVAAAGLVAVESMIDRLAEDHRRATALSDGLLRVGGWSRVSAPATNIVLVDPPATGADGATWERALRASGVLVRPNGAYGLRVVTHRHVDDHAVAVALGAFAAVAEQLR